ncbi:hypothetical protein [Streptomyces sp. NPDC001137]|uniref:hypothetical protein n=1 Tax=Streptomyces sp. NPDC001137 TaxID=3154378 RepID=UPI00331D7C40
MTPTEHVEEIAFDPGLSVDEKAERVTAFFAQQGDRGVAMAADTLTETNDLAVAQYIASYLELTPAGHDVKTRAAERLRGAGPVAQAAARLVPWLPEHLIDAFVDDYFASPDPESPLTSVIFAIGVYRPDRLRPYADRIESPTIRRSLLSGARDEVADALMTRWRKSRDLDNLHALALVRTPHAVDLITSVRDDIDDPEDWEWLMPLAGRLPDSGGESGLRPAYMGFVADQGESPHVMGGRYVHDVPLCARCGAPADRVLTLSAQALPHRLRIDPSFFWFSCDCDEVDVLTVRCTPQGTHAYFQPQGPSAEISHAVPGERSMVLELHPNQTGVSLPAITGSSRHQIGGLPRWPSPELHPICPECGKFMPFLAAVDSGPTLFGPMGFGGTLFGFWCDDCSVSTTQLQD